MNAACRLAAILSALLFAACSATSSNPGLPLSQNQSGQAAPHLPMARSARPNLYVIGGYVNTHTSFINVYAPGQSQLLRTISQGITAPMAMVFDRSGNLYVANGVTLQGKKWVHGNIEVYAPGSTTPFRTITQGVSFPVAMAFDRTGNLTVIMSAVNKSPDNIASYAPSDMHLVRQITSGLDVPSGLAFDASGNLYVPNYYGNTISVYAPGKTSVLRTIDVQNPSDVTFGHSGYLYVADAQSADGYSPGQIQVFAPGGSLPVRTIATTDGYVAGALRWDASHNLYAIEEKRADAHYGVIDEYAKGGSSPTRTIQQNGLIPVDQEFDSSGNLYVADCITCNGGDGKDAVRVYPPGAKSPSMTLYVPGAEGLAFGP